MDELSRSLNLPSSPTRLTLLDAISLDCDMNNALSSKSDLPRYMLRRIMLLDTSSRKLPNIGGQVNTPRIVNSNPLSSFLDEDEDDDLIHPMDIFLYLFQISTPSFRQTIVNQVAKCQLSLPLITHDSDKNEVVLNHFAFQTLVLNRYVDGNDAKCFSVLEEPIPIVSFIRVGDCDNSQKSELLNRILNVRHEYFSHSNCPDSTKKRFLLNGTVEIAWYLPKYRENININHHFVLLNLRGDASLYTKQSNFIGEISNLVYVFVPLSKLTHEMSCQLEKFKEHFKSKVIFLVYKTKSQKNPAIKVIPNILNDENSTIALHKKNLSEDSGRIAKSISLFLDSTNHPPIPLSQCIQRALDTGIMSDLIKNDIKLRQEFVYSICDDFPCYAPDELNPSPMANMKDKLLPLQGYFRNWAESSRELQLLAGSKRNVEEHINTAQKKQQEARLSQIQKLSKPSSLICGIMNQCHKYSTDKNEILIFFELLEDKLNTISSKYLPILYNQYKKWLMESYSKQPDSIPLAERDAKQQQAKRKLAEAAECITRSSLGIEHVFRELGQIYEAFISSNDAKLKTSIKNRLKFRPTLLPDIIANLIIQGHSFEILNGDDNHIPLMWVSDVLSKLSKILGTDKKLFVISVLGIQSSGKSTLLNTMFGIKFPVSSGRCTRGVFLQMIPITEELKNKIGFDFLFLLDTEGLRAPELSGGLSYRRDNELATFTVGLADLALINIKGESHSEVQDILQIIVIAFMRMKLTSNKPKCIFVHQNVGDPQAKLSLMIARNNLIDTLNEMTVCAAQQENKELQFSKFCDVIEFNPEEDVFYFPSLFEGEPPMTSIAPGYIERAQELRTKIITSISYQNRQYQIIREWKRKLLDIWNSVLKENFVFSYKNILEVNARVELDNALCYWHSFFIQEMAAVKSGLLNRLYNVEYESLQDTMQRIQVELHTMLADTDSHCDRIIDYFFIQHGKKAIFEQWRYQTEQFFICCKEKEIRKILEDCETICKVGKQKQDIDSKFRDYRKEIVFEVRRIFDSSRDQESFDIPGYMDSKFEILWKNWKSPFNDTSCLGNTDISYDLQQILFESSQLKQLDVFSSRKDYIFDKNKFKLVGMGEFSEISKNLSKNEGEFSYYQVLDYQNSIWSFGEIMNFFSRKENEPNAIQRKLQSILIDQTNTIDETIRKLPNNSNYSANYFCILIDKCITLIYEHNKSEKLTNARQSIILNNYYIFDFVFYQCCRAIKQFESLQENFLEQNSLELKLEELESILKENFFHLCTGIKSENICANQLASITLKGMRTYLEDTVIQNLQKLFINTSEYKTIYSSRASLQLSILKHLAKKKDFDSYISYINSPFIYISTYIESNILEYSQRLSTINSLFVDVTQSAHHFKTRCINAAISANTQDIQSWDGWKRHFHDAIVKVVRKVKLSDLDILDLYNVNNYQHFSELFSQSLNRSMEQFEWKAWVEEILNSYQYKEIKDNIANTIIECRALCPFCREPCQLSAGEHEHYCGTFHRPQGISGWHYKESKQIALEECTKDVLYKNKFLYHKKSYNYSDYRTVNEYFNSWRILGEDSIEAKYWQWVLYTFHKEFVDHYGLVGNEEIDIGWVHLNEEEVIDDIERHYQNYVFKTIF
ncbi:Interferon-induced very large GTPase 1-like [Oopsacas minuta]|uniref:Interferon-induced very large GTPase 1-like n=1 Tax=Oopsacas minuta TaxID=111878 RepID=A0AAV7KCM5_9METZ|nr:Interferon-induced very large GTPase 1-like [Oopsacas minuta]